MKKQQALDILAQNKALLQEKYGVTKIALFGSTARDTATQTSDIDILISFDEKANSKKYFGVLFYLEDIFKCPIDLITENALRPELQPYVDLEKIYV
ncbi:nucleotidyltransferase family protein [Crocosphaera sp.]|uniref:nucleotidyltransferase family protein n=1 Tax=Crocosphaera sp. TaxID=2729996 RepID=UPI002611FD29|nr:nucleotidyltransferase family protein [Crocosphaera sp.]MDJ0578521.1 nucleotidyltransferase family protein [Crocosphaera sp.]